MTRRSAQASVDEGHMRRCIELARKAVGRTSPNPLVGCVIVSPAGEVVAEGYHRGPGTDHAEIDALKKLGRVATGCTLYTNLEPCAHQGRTPPCAPAVAEAGVARVVIGNEDPIPGHGRGLGLLRRRRVSVTKGVLAAECARLNLGFLTAGITGRRPAFILKAAMTMDGKIATVAGRSKWITGPEARHSVLALRNEYDAIMVGIGTVLADDPRLSCHGEKGLRDPHRIVLDSKLRTPPTARLLARGKGVRVIIACGRKAPAAKEKALVAKGAEVLRCRTHANGQVDLYDLADELHRRDIQSVLVEGGGQVHAYLIDKGYADLLYLYMAPLVFGGPAPSWVGGTGHATVESAARWDFDPVIHRIGGDFRFTATRRVDAAAHPTQIED